MHAENTCSKKHFSYSAAEHLLEKTSSSTSQATKADSGSTQTDGVPAQNDAASSMANSVQSDNNVLTKQDTGSKPPESLGPESNNPGQSAKVISTIPVTMFRPACISDS